MHKRYIGNRLKIHLLHGRISDEDIFANPSNTIFYTEKIFILVQYLIFYICQHWIRFILLSRIFFLTDRQQERQLCSARALSKGSMKRICMYGLPLSTFVVCVYQSDCLSVSLFMCLLIYLPIYLSLSVSLHLLCFCIFLSVCVVVCLSVSLSIFLFIYLLVYLFVYLSI